VKTPFSSTCATVETIATMNDADALAAHDPNQICDANDGVEDEGGRPPESRTETTESASTSTSVGGSPAPSVRLVDVGQGAERKGANGSQRSALWHAIEGECKKRIARAQAEARRRRLSQKDFARRTRTSAPSRSRGTQKAVLHPHFDPRHVLGNIDSVAHAVAKAIGAGTYKPIPAVDIKVPKTGGGTRTVTQFSIVDAAVSKWLLQRLAKRYDNMLSTYAYGFRPDRGLADAVENIAREVRRGDGFYVVEVDFKDFFDNVDHAYLFQILKEMFRLGPRDLQLVKTLVTTPRAASREAYRAGETHRPTKGIPQGSSVSLFLANAVCWELDRELESSGARFARWADDVVAICSSEKIAKRVMKIMRGQATRAGTPINKKKSPGIRHFGHDSPEGIERIDAIEFVGHSITKDGVGIASKSLNKFLDAIDRIVFLHLLHDPQRGHLPKRWSLDDERRELLSLMRELRSYIYGRGVKEADLRTALSRRAATKPARGIIARYTALDHGCAETLRAIDRYIVNAITKTHAARWHLFRAHGLNPPIIERHAFAHGSWHEGVAQALVPSALYAWHYARLVRCAGMPMSTTYDVDAVEISWAQEVGIKAIASVKGLS
jgi:hypothetical protein